jgi:site-specific DNA-methyltransferase (adenine-specific)
MELSVDTRMQVDDLISGYEHKKLEHGVLVFADCFDWLKEAPENSIHAVVTDPPYGVKEYDTEQLEKRENGQGGIWRIPPEFDGNKRSPLPRFTALTDADIERLKLFFIEWSRSVFRVLRPGGHIIIASNALLSQVVFSSVAKTGFEFRGQIIRLVRTLRGGDRPKNAEKDFPNVCSMPRGNYEPWGLFRKPIPNGMTVADCLSKYETGGLRRKPNGKPFEDVISSERTPKAERDIADHPSLKPQSFMRQIVYASLPLGQGLILDPFMGSGSTIAAAEFLGYKSIGIERLHEYYEMSISNVTKLAKIRLEEDQLPLL